MNPSVLLAENISVRIPVRIDAWGRRRSIVPVAGVDLRLAEGETLGLVGESGCGKTTLARVLTLHMSPTGGRLVIGGRDVSQLTRGELRRWRRRTQLVFQEPGASLDPRRTVRRTLSEALAEGRAEERGERGVGKLLDEVGLPSLLTDRYPHQLSGGQQQRVAIARALAVTPQIIVADEPTSALDVTVQARLIRLLARLRRERGLALLLVSHDLPLVERSCDRLAVMYLGHVVEVVPLGGAGAPRHPYSRSLMAAAPSLKTALREGGGERTPMEAGGAGSTPAGVSAEPPSLLDPPSGCPFAPRCPIAVDGCRKRLPGLLEAAPGHFLRCPVAAAKS